MKRGYWWGLGAIALLVVMVMSLRACRQGEGNLGGLSPEEEKRIRAGLTLRDVVLEQPDDNGQLLWRVSAEEVSYTPNQRTANIVRPRGELYQDGELIYRVSAESGEILDNGKRILLTGNIVATGVKNQAVLRGEEMEWQPELALMTVRNTITGTHPQLRANAQEARIYDRENRMELDGEVVANTVVEDPTTEPWVKLQADLLEWNWEAETVASEQPLKVERLRDNRVIEVVTGATGSVNLAENRATLVDDVRVLLIETPLEIRSDRAVWAYQEERIDVESPLSLDHAEQNITLTAQQGNLDLRSQQAFLTREVVAVGRRNNSRLAADRLTWNLQAQTLLAEGNVNYRQGDPPVTVRSPRALGRIEAETILLDGGRVVTEIVPQ